MHSFYECTKMTPLCWVYCLQISQIHLWFGRNLNLHGPLTEPPPQIPISLNLGLRPRFGLHPWFSGNRFTLNTLRVLCALGLSFALNSPQHAHFPATEEDQIKQDVLPPLDFTSGYGLAGKENKFKQGIISLGTHDAREFLYFYY